MATTRAVLPAPVQTEIDFKNMTLEELTKTCRENNWKGHSMVKNKKDKVAFCEKKYKEDNADILCSICNRIFCDCSALSEKDKKIKELQDKVKEYELKEAFEEPEDNFQDAISDESIICGKCGERGHNSYDCKKENCFEFNSEYENIKDSPIRLARDTLNIYKNQMEYTKKKEEETEKEMTEMLIENERLKSFEDQVIQENKEKETYKEREEEVLSCVIKKIDYNIKSLNKESNKDHKERYNLFIKQRNGSDKQIILFHGTDEKNIQSIMENGLSLTTNKANGAAYGEGIYFSGDINFAMRYSKCSHYVKNILICQVYVNNIIEGKKAMTTFPKVPGENVYYDTSVNDLNKLQIYVKKDLEQINILAHIKIDTSAKNNSIPDSWKSIVQSSGKTMYINKHTGEIRSTRPPCKNNNNINKFTIKIENKTNNTIYIYWNHIKEQSIYNIDLTQCKIMGRPELPNAIKSIDTNMGHRFVVGYYDKDKHFNIVKIIVSNKDKETFTIN
jgi:hypothetical protein